MPINGSKNSQYHPRLLLITLTSFPVCKPHENFDTKKNSRQLILLHHYEKISKVADHRMNETAQYDTIPLSTLKAKEFVILATPIVKTLAPATCPQKLIPK